MNERRRSVAIVILVAVGLLVLAVALRLSPLLPGPATPPGATRLVITTAAPHVWPTTACPLALLLPVRVASDDGTLVVVSVETGDPIDVVWPAGWAAWRIDGVAELHARDGSLVAREGDVLDDLGGGSGDDGAFHVCIVGS